MNPNNPTPPGIPGLPPNLQPPGGVNASEYLNQISGQGGGKKKFLDKKMMIILGGVFAMILVVVIIVASSSNSGDFTSKLAIAKLKYDNLISIVDYGNKNLSSSSTSRVNATAALVIGTQTAKVTGMNGKNKPSKESTAKIGDTKQLLKELDTAKAAGRLDGTFVTNVTEYIDTVVETLTSIKNEKSISKTNRDMASTYISQLQEIKARFVD
jgi:hypothetical protein